MARLVGEVRAALGCEPAPQNPSIRLTQAIYDSRQGLEFCGLSLNRNNAGANLSCSAPERCLTTRGQRFAGYISTDLRSQESSGNECKSKIRGQVETITCKFRNADEKYKNTFQLSGGRLISLSSEESTSNTKFNCDVSTAGSASRSGQQRPGKAKRE